MAHKEHPIGTSYVEGKRGWEKLLPITSRCHHHSSHRRPCLFREAFFLSCVARLQPGGWGAHECA